MAGIWGGGAYCIASKANFVLTRVGIEKYIAIYIAKRIWTKQANTQ